MLWLKTCSHITMTKGHENHPLAQKASTQVVHEPLSSQVIKQVDSHVQLRREGKYCPGLAWPGRRGLDEDDLNFHHILPSGQGTVTVAAGDGGVGAPQGREGGAGCPKPLPGGVGQPRVGGPCVSKTARSSHTQRLDPAASRSPRGPTGTRSPGKRHARTLAQGEAAPERPCPDSSELL